MRNCLQTAPFTALLIAGILCQACTDWQANGGGQGPALVGGAQVGQPVGGAARSLPDGGPTWVETWQAPGVETAPSGGADAAVATDGAAGADGTAATDGSSLDAGQVDGGPFDVQEDTGPVEVVIVLPDGGVPPFDAVDDASNADLAGEDAKVDAAEVEISPYTFDGKADFVGWPELPAEKDVAPDLGTPVDAGPADLGGTDAEADIVLPPPDGGVEPMDAAPPPDALPPLDVPVPDDTLAAPDATIADSNPADAGVADAGAPDITVIDTAPTDAAQPDVSATDNFVPDPGTVDTALPDLPPNETSQDAGSGEATTVDGLTVPDWQGYPPDLPYGSDADIYGGPIGSCLSLWLYQNELCGDTHPTADCINGAAKDGSLYSQFLFDPLRECETAVCTSLCASATDKSCMEGCIGKYCTAQFLACTSNAASGSDTCGNTWTCSQQYKDKLLTISAKCYANASFPEQKKFANILSCVSKPQTKSCLPEIATCFAPPGNGTETCSNTLICIDNCKNNESCGFACMGKGTPKTVSLLDAIWSCQIEKCNPKCAGSPDPKCSDTCMQSECKDPLVQCLID